MKETTDILRNFLNEETACFLILNLSEIGAMETIVANLFNANDEILVIDTGYFGNCWKQICSNYDLNIHPKSNIHNLTDLNGYVSEEIQPKSIEKILEEDTEKRIKAVLCLATDPSTSIRLDFEKIGPIVKKYNRVFVINAISEISVTPISIKNHCIDVLIAGKPAHLDNYSFAGISAIGINQDIVPLIFKSKKRSCYLDLRKEIIRNGTINDNDPRYLAPSANELLSFHQFFYSLQNCDLTKRYEDLKNFTIDFRANILNHGLELFARSHTSRALSVIKIPRSEKREAAIELLQKKYRNLVSRNIGKLREETIVINHLNHQYFQKKDCDNLLEILKNVL